MYILIVYVDFNKIIIIIISIIKEHLSFKSLQIYYTFSATSHPAVYNAKI